MSGNTRRLHGVTDRPDPTSVATTMRIRTARQLLTDARFCLCPLPAELAGLWVARTRDARTYVQTIATDKPVATVYDGGATGAAIGQVLAAAPAMYHTLFQAKQRLHTVLQDNPGLSSDVYDTLRTTLDLCEQALFAAEVWENYPNSEEEGDGATTPEESA